MKEGDIVVASDNTILEHEICRHREESPGSATRVFTSSERLSNQLKKNETDDPKVEELEVV